MLYKSVWEYTEWRMKRKAGIRNKAEDVGLVHMIDGIIVNEYDEI